LKPKCVCFAFPKFSCEILESLIRYGWEIITSGRTTTTPGFEYITWVFKSGTTAVLYNAEVVSLVIGETSGSLKVVPSNPQINNAVKRAIDNILAPKLKTPEVTESAKRYEHIVTFCEFFFFGYCYFLKKEVARGGERTRVLWISYIFSFSPLCR
jgi:hypothetical protein